MSCRSTRARRELLLSVPQLRGGPDVLHGPPGPVADAVAGLRAIHALLEPDVAERVIFDLGLSRAPGYYTGAVFEVYDPAVGYADRRRRPLRPPARPVWARPARRRLRPGGRELHQALAAEERLAEVP